MIMVKIVMVYFKVLVGDFLATMSIYIPYTHLPSLALAHGIKVDKFPAATFYLCFAHINYHLSCSKSYSLFDPIPPQ